MKKWLRITIVVLLVAILGLALWKNTAPGEPEYQGKLLSAWLEGHVPTSSANPPYNSPGWHKAEEALRQIGTNAISTLLRMIRAHDSPWRLKMVRLAEKQRLVRFRHRYAMPLNEEAEYAFRVLGTNAVSAVPDLVEIYEENLSASSQSCAALALGSIGRPAKAAVPALLKNFTHTNDYVRLHAVSAVMYIGGEPDLVLPALGKALKDPHKSVRWNAAVGLHNFGARARAAVPALLEALKDETINEPVEHALWGIAPEAIAKVLVVEDSTPMVTNGVTSEALGRIFGNQISTLVRPGTAVPCARYSGWGSDPDSQLQIMLEVYRGANRTITNDHFLGRFEVMGIPPPPSRTHVQVAFVIVNQQILLCAYDDRRRVFLEIRRVDNSTAK